MALDASKREPTAFGISARTARALADPWRLRILAEVSVRPLSPSRFIEEIGGELNHISRCFRQLAEWGYIEVVEERPGRRQGAAIEHVYRAIRRAHFDTWTWEHVPASERESASRSVIDAYQRRIKEALQADTLDQDADRHLSWDAVALDRTSWEQLGERLDDILHSLSELELEASKRLATAGGEQIPTTVGLAAFRSPGSPSWMLQGARRHQGPADAPEPRSLFVFGPKLAKALSNPWRYKILAEASTRPLSPSQFIEKAGGSMTHVSRCFRELAGWGYLEVIEERKGGRRGGGIERIYRSTRRPYFDTATWEALPQIVRNEISQFFLDTYFDRVTDAMQAGTFDFDTDRHLSWKPAVIDRQAWSEITNSLDEVLAWLPDLETQSLERTQDVESLIPTTVGLACFRSPSQSNNER